MFLFYFGLLLYMFFIIWILEGYKNVIKEDKIDKDYNPSVSVVIAAKNEKNNLNNLIEFLINQVYKNYEVIIVNDKSTDTTESILKENCSKFKNLSYITIKSTPKDWSSKKWAIYNGILLAKGNIIIQTDADCYMSNKWISIMIAPFKSADVGFVSSLTPTYYNKKNIFKDLFLMDSIAQDAFSGYAIGRNLTLSCNARSIAFRKKYFMEVNGYEGIKHIVSGDDDLLLHKIVHYIGCRVKFILNKSGAVFSAPPNNIANFCNQRLRFASKGLLYYKKDFISKEMRIILPFLFLINLMACFLILKFCKTGHPVYCIPLIFKLISDYLIIYPIYDLYNYKWNWFSFIIVSIVHPFYIIIFAMIGPIYNFKWK